MKKILNSQFLKDQNNLFKLHDKFTFGEFYKILRKNSYEPDQALNFIFAHCSLSTMVFQECIISYKYKNRLKIL